MTSDALREKFLSFFQGKNHAIVPSDSLVPASDPTLLFTGAGMNQFKEYFLGLKREMKRAASIQKCLRTGDVEEVGKTPSHLTFFEMLGNFSFGDYFKEEAILWAWEFFTAVLRLSPDRLWASVYKEDEEAARVWEKKIGLAPERIVRFGAKENFWPSEAPTKGPNGPCGPCSEIYFDYERCLVGKTCPDPDHCAPGCPCGRFVEVWNLVFTQFDRTEGGKLDPLPAKNIDTGMGLERLAAVMQGKMSVFETDLFEPILEAVIRLLREEAPKVLKADQRSAVCAIADHVRALTFLIGDGVIPGNVGRGYVLRMLLRRAARHGMGLGLIQPFLHRLVPAVAKTMQAPYPQLQQRRESIAKVILMEEERFFEMLRDKMPLLEEGLKKYPTGFPAEQAAKVYDTHGLSLEEITEACKKMGIAAPARETFEKALASLQASSKLSSGFRGAIFSKDEVRELLAGLKRPSRFTGYETLTGKGKVTALLVDGRLADEVKTGGHCELLLDQSPFYGESGGQVGDQGFVRTPEGEAKVLDTQWAGDSLLHRCEVVKGKIRVNDTASAAVDVKRRQAVAKNHTATHLLHAALRKILGDHVVQAGSLVAPDRLRFDFSHSMAPSSRQMRSVEEIVNEWVEANLSVSAAEMPKAEAQAAGAIALFGEKYACLPDRQGDKVRVVSIGDVSKELCGGTHLRASGEVGLFTLAEEGSVAAGIRRVEALTGQGAFSRLKSESQQLEELAQLLKTNPQQLPEAIDRLMKQVRELQDRLQESSVKNFAGDAERLLSEKVEIGQVAMVSCQLPEQLRHESLRILADAIRAREKKAVIFLCDQSGNCIVAVGPEAQKAGIRANDLLAVASQIAGGSGGGSPQLAQGKLKDSSNFSQVRKQLEQWVEGRFR